MNSVVDYAVFLEHFIWKKKNLLEEGKWEVEEEETKAEKEERRV